MRRKISLMAYIAGIGSGHRSTSSLPRTGVRGQQSWGRPADSDQNDGRLSDSESTSEEGQRQLQKYRQTRQLNNWNDLGAPETQTALAQRPLSLS